jgi:hypothetical protein
MPDFETAAKVASNYGLGVLSFLALMYGGWRLLGWLEKVSEWLEEIKTNHLVHVQNALDKQTELLGDIKREHGAKLEEILKK